MPGLNKHLFECNKQNCHAGFFLRKKIKNQYTHPLPSPEVISESDAYIRRESKIYTVIVGSRVDVNV